MTGCFAMNTKFFINFTELDMELVNLRNKVDDLDTSIQSVPETEKCDGIMISEYIDRIEKISQLLENYKDLVFKDISEIKKTESIARIMDERVKQLFKNTRE